MTSAERHEARYQRRKAQRRSGHGLTLEQVYTMQNLQAATNRCRNGVMWKEDPIRYTTHAIVSNKRMKDEILSGKMPKYHAVRMATIYERGKQRELHMVDFADRVPQKCLCTNALIPELLPSAIYDNAASQKDRGVAFSRRRVIRHLQRAIYKNGVENTYVLVADLSGFFKSIPHGQCRKVTAKAFDDDRITDLTMHYIKMYHRPTIMRIDDSTERKALEMELNLEKAKGCTLGSEISQDMAIAVPSALDHELNDKIVPSHRYMDDIIMFGTKPELQRALAVLSSQADEIGLRVNCKKTHIQKITEPFTFLKVRYQVSGTGKIIRQCARADIVRQRRRLKAFLRRVNAGTMKRDDVFQSMVSWLAHLRGTKSWRIRKNMIKRYQNLFGKYRVDRLEAI